MDSLSISSDRELTALIICLEVPQTKNGLRTDKWHRALNVSLAIQTYRSKDGEEKRKRIEPLKSIE
jgi:hypothetical protein